MTEVGDKEIRLRPFRRARLRKRLLELVIEKKTMDPQILEDKRRQRIQETLALMNNNDSRHKDAMLHSRYTKGSDRNEMKFPSVLLPAFKRHIVLTSRENSSDDPSRMINEQTDKEAETDTDQPQIKKRSKFCIAVLCVLIAYRLRRSYKLRQSDRDMLDFFAGLDSGNLMGFDYRVRVSNDTERILSSPSSDRKPEELHKVQAELQSVKSLADYPISMQHRIAKFGRYASFGAERVIVRYGQRPAAFYFLLSGSAIFVEGDPEQVGRAVSVINKGDNFGDDAIINQCRRNCTVISREIVELLVIQKEDFIDIFMGGGMKNFLDATYNVFIKSIFIFKKWPLHVFHTNTKKCMFKYYKRGAVIVEDSKKSEWIYIIKSGSCSVLKMLKRGGADKNEDSWESTSSNLDSGATTPRDRRPSRAPGLLRKKSQQASLLGLPGQGDKQLNRRLSTVSMTSSYMPQIPIDDPTIESDIEEEPELEGAISQLEADTQSKQKMSSVSFAQGPFLTHNLSLRVPAVTTASEARKRRMAAARGKLKTRRDSVHSTISQLSTNSSHNSFISNKSLSKRRRG
ncbi:uncharacterized protein LOC144438745 isoform X2 [Glandiceps talaboti]